jgi:putative SOS response-associated peptidase YedK
MCGRFRLARKKEILEAVFEADAASDDLDWSPDYLPRYNLAPGQEIVAVRRDAVQPVRRMSLLNWGLIPSWTRESLSGFKMINVRSETLATKPSFSELLRSRRCLIPADGFYEWKREGKEKLPFCFTLADESVFALAGLWDRWKSPLGQIVESCTILTTNPNELTRDVHDRMPVILPRDAYGTWLDPGFTHLPELHSLLKPYPALAMRRYRVSQRVNQVKNDDAECAAEIEAA